MERCQKCNERVSAVAREADLEVAEVKMWSFTLGATRRDDIGSPGVQGHGTLDVEVQPERPD